MLEDILNYWFRKIIQNIHNYYNYYIFLYQLLLLQVVILKDFASIRKFFIATRPIFYLVIPNRRTSTEIIYLHHLTISLLLFKERLPSTNISIQISYLGQFVLWTIFICYIGYWHPHLIIEFLYLDSFFVFCVNFVKPPDFHLRLGKSPLNKFTNLNK